jgi:class 3 adenylate cyclase
MTDEPVRGGFPDPALYQLPGIDQARAYLREVTPRPPLSHLVGMRLTHVGVGTATVTVAANPWLQVLDGAIDPRPAVGATLELAVITSVPAGKDVRTAAVSISHFRPCTLDHAPLVLRGRVVHTGPNFTLAEVDVEDALGRQVMNVNGSVLVRDVEGTPTGRPWRPQPVAEPVYRTPAPHLRPLPHDVMPVLLRLIAEESMVTLTRRIMAGEIASVPIWDLLGIRVLDISEGSMVTSVPATEWLCSHTRRLQAGALATLALGSLSGPALTLSPPNWRLGIIDQSISFFRPVLPDGREILSRGRVVHHDGDLIHSTAEITDADGNRVAIGHQTSLIAARHQRRAAPEPERVLATVLFTDIVGSTEHAERLGDAKWREVLDDHHAVVRSQLQAFKGREVKTMGDGFLAAFDSPARAVQCARAIRDGVSRFGIEIRAGLHSGECDVVGADLAGIAVHVASRVQAAAAPGEVLVSSTVRDLVAGSGLRFTDHGRHHLKGLDGEWHLLAVAD